MSFLRCVGILMCAWVFEGLGTGPIASTQDKKADEPPGIKHVDVFNLVEGRTKVALVKPEGSRVKMGEMVCILDSSLLKDRLGKQELAVKGAEATYQNAKHTREVAEIAVTEYVDVVYKRQLIEAEERIKEVEAVLDLVKDDAEWINRIQEKGYLLWIKRAASERLNLQRVTFALEQAKTHKAVLEKYTKDKTIRELKSVMEGARSVEVAAKTAFEQEQAIGNTLLKQIANCTVITPVEGRVRYLWPIEAGATVREGDILFRIIAEDEQDAGAK